MVDGQCISSSNFPEPYPEWDYCEFEAPPLDPQRLLVMDVAAFSTQQDYDFLGVNGIWYTGNMGPPQEVPRGPLYWFDDAHPEWPSTCAALIRPGM